MEFKFSDSTFEKVLEKAGIAGDGIKVKFSKVLIPFLICWVPLAVITLFQGTFWTGDHYTSFISHMDTQVRFLVALPIFILADSLVNPRLNLIIGQFANSGILNKSDYVSYNKLIDNNVSLLNSKWATLIIIILCYTQVFFVLYYESTSTALLSWQVYSVNEIPTLTIAGWWTTLISRPILLFLLYRWLYRIFIWGKLLREISKFNLNLFAIHPDLAGGLGFLGYAIRYFSPVAFAISAGVAGNMIDLIQFDGATLADLKVSIFAYTIFITLIFSIPLLSFTNKLILAREQSVFESYDFANGIYRELNKKLSKSYDKVTAEDLKSPDYSAASDLSQVINNSLNMKTIPFTFKDLIPLWVMTLIPFSAVVLMEIPINKIFNSVISLII